MNIPFSENYKAPKAFDCHSLLHRKVPKSIRAVNAADVADGDAVLQNHTLKLLAVAFDVSVSSILAAKRLTPSERDAVRLGFRPLALPKPVPALPAPLTAEQRLVDIVGEIGVAAALDVLSAIDTAINTAAEIVRIDQGVDAAIARLDAAQEGVCLSVEWRNLDQRAGV